MKTAQRRLEETKESPGLRVGPNPEIVRIQEIVIAEIVAENLAQAPGISDPEPKEEAIETLEAEAAAGGSSAKALDPCLETGEVGEGPARPAKEHLGHKVEEVVEKVVESPVEVVEKGEIFRQSIEAGAEAKAKAEEPVVESPVKAIPDKVVEKRSKNPSSNRLSRQFPIKSSRKLMRLSKRSKNL